MCRPGSSEDGRAFAARHAEAIFTAHQTLGSAQDFYADIKRQAASLGRNPDHIKVLPGISPFIGSTEAEARRIEEEVNALIQPAFSLAQLKRLIGLDLTGHDLDGPFPRHLAHRRRFRREQPLQSGARHRRPGEAHHPPVDPAPCRRAGPLGYHRTPEQVADAIQTWFENGAADGFNVMPPFLPKAFEVFVAEVLPILRRRGLFREDYAGATLREHYRLPPLDGAPPPMA